MSNMDMIRLRECIEEIKGFCLDNQDDSFIEDEYEDKNDVDDPEYGHCSTVNIMASVWYVVIVMMETNIFMKNFN